jgi:uncharacterized protein with GYD domain
MKQQCHKLCHVIKRRISRHKPIRYNRVSIFEGNENLIGIKNVKDSVKRAKSFEGAIEKAGGKSRGIYYTMGRYDIVVIEAPSDEAIASVLYNTASPGNIHTETLRVFNGRSR